MTTALGARSRSVCSTGETEPGLQHSLLITKQRKPSEFIQTVFLAFALIYEEMVMLYSLIHRSIDAR